MDKVITGRCERFVRYLAAAGGVELGVLGGGTPRSWLECHSYCLSQAGDIFLVSCSNIVFLQNALLGFLILFLELIIVCCNYRCAFVVLKPFSRRCVLLSTAR